MNIGYGRYKTGEGPRKDAHHNRLRREIIWKEVVMLTLIAIFSFMFYNGLENTGLYIAFLVISGALYTVALAEENVERKEKKFDDYFFHISSYFAVAFVFFFGGLFMLNYEIPLLGLAMAIGIIMFSAGLMHLIFERIENE